MTKEIEVLHDHDIPPNTIVINKGFGMKIHKIEKLSYVRAFAHRMVVDHYKQLREKSILFKWLPCKYGFAYGGHEFLVDELQLSHDSVKNNPSQKPITMHIDKNGNIVKTED